ncbi:MAG: hypothetical protein K6C40_06585 [Thermoguttaceae bacterium]|nr:hypothetical protein [Thermoguttaceae bacterium]
MQDYTPYQQKIIKRYYDNYEDSGRQRLGELATDLYLAEGKKLANGWKRAEEIMRRLKVPEARIQIIMESKDPALLAKLVKDLG